jgi:hypothetical protein
MNKRLDQAAHKINLKLTKRAQDLFSEFKKTVDRRGSDEYDFSNGFSALVTRPFKGTSLEKELKGIYELEIFSNGDKCNDNDCEVIKENVITPFLEKSTDPTVYKLQYLDWNEVSKLLLSIQSQD